MSDAPRPPIDLTAYWNRRYDTIDATKSGHIDLPAEYNEWLYRRKQAHVRRVVARVGGSLRDARLLEIAAGSGAWMAFWQAQGVGDYCGIDLSERAVEGLRERFPQHRFLQHDLNDLRVGDAVGAGYDCVSAIDVLYHVVDDDRFGAVLSDLASVLKPGGLLILHDQFLHGPPQEYGGYIRWRALTDYEAALHTAGFEVLDRRPTFFVMVQAADFSGWSAKLMHALWDRLERPAIERAPRLTGAIGYAVDTAICSVLKNGPSFNVMVCRKRS
jgi:SAM-dependent methyltransferase